MIKILILIVSIVYVYNYSGFMYDLTKGFYRLLNPEKPYMGQPLFKPIGCTLCMVWWITILYSILFLKLSIIYSLGIGVGSSIGSMLIDKVLGKVIDLINKI